MWRDLTSHDQHLSRLQSACFPVEEPEDVLLVLCPYVLRHFVEGLSKVNNAAVSMPAIDKIVYDAVLVAFYRLGHQRQQSSGCPPEAPRMG